MRKPTAATLGAEAQVLCDRIRFDPSAALAYKGKLYQQKLATLVKSGKSATGYKNVCLVRGAKTKRFMAKRPAGHWGGVDGATVCQGSCVRNFFRGSS